MNRGADIRKALRTHWSEYLYEAVGLGLFMVSAGVFGTLLEHAGSPVRQARFNHTGSLVASASTDRTLCVGDVASGARRFLIADQRASLTSVAFSPDDRRLAVGDESGAVRLFDAASGELLQVLLAGDTRVNSIAFHPDGSRVATAGEGVHVLDARANGQLLHIRPHRDTVWHLSFSPDGKRLASCSWDGTIVVSESTPLRRRLQQTGETR